MTRYCDEDIFGRGGRDELDDIVRKLGRVLTDFSEAWLGVTYHYSLFVICTGARAFEGLPPQPYCAILRLLLDLRARRNNSVRLSHANVVLFYHARDGRTSECCGWSERI